MIYTSIQKIKQRLQKVVEIECNKLDPNITYSINESSLSSLPLLLQSLILPYTPPPPSPHSLPPISLPPPTSSPNSKLLSIVNENKAIVYEPLSGRESIVEVGEGRFKRFCSVVQVD